MASNQVWVVRDPSGAIVGAGAERRIDSGGILVGDGPFAALDNAFGRYSTRDAYRALTKDVERANADRYEAFGYTLALETLASAAEARVVTRLWLVVTRFGDVCYRSLPYMGDTDTLHALARKWDTENAHLAPHRVVRVALMDVTPPSDTTHRTEESHGH